MNINKRKHILTKAAELFRTQGYHATSLSQILKTTETQKGTIYHYFPQGKEQLAIEAIEQTGKIREDFIKYHFSIEEDIALAIYNQVIEMANSSIEILEAPPKESVNISLVSMSSEVWYSNDTLREACLKVYTDWQNLYYNQLVKKGFDKETSKALSITIQSMIEGAYVLSVTKKNLNPMKTIGDSIYKIIKNNNKE